ncbi:MAG: alkaline phosphatase family protein [Cyanobacteria bacterium P01_C01_bin.73]
MNPPVIAIGLDAADPQLLETWMDQGHLKTLQRLRQGGTYGRLLNLDSYRAETPWTTFLTGVLPEETGYWGPIKYNPDTYQAQEVRAYKFKDYPPFYALGDQYRVAVFDMPQSALSEQVNGWQVLAWGAHSAQVDSQSSPSDLFQTVVDRHGAHPMFNRDYADCRNLEALERLQRGMETGISRRAKICQDWLQQKPWDLLLTVFGETHTAGHYHWHLSQPHPIHKVGVPQAEDGLLKIYQAVDRAIAEIVDAAPQEANILVFAAHGMGANVMDLPSMLFLPELLYRWSFPGQYGLAFSRRRKSLKSPKTAFKKRAWIGEVWDLKYEKNPLRSWLRQNLPTRLYHRLEALLGKGDGISLASPYEQQAASDPLFWQPANWYKPLWPQMKAFALPSFSEGYVRINVKGREAKGIVSPKDYDAVCEQITTELKALKDIRYGHPMVDKVIRTRQSALEQDPKLPDADLIIIWQEEFATDGVESPAFGRIGPVPYLRTGSHRAEGFLLGNGPNFDSGESLPEDTKALDLAPTILDLMGAQPPSYIEGRSILKQTTGIR